MCIRDRQVAEIAGDVGTTPANFSPGVYSMIRNISESVIIPIAGLILTFIACYELIQLIIDHNNLANFETWIFFKWIFKTFVAVTLITNTFNIVMAVFDVAQNVVNASSGIIAAGTAVDASTLEAMEETLMGMDIGCLLYTSCPLFQGAFAGNQVQHQEIERGTDAACRRSGRVQGTPVGGAGGCEDSPGCTPLAQSSGVDGPDGGGKVVVVIHAWKVTMQENAVQVF